MTDRMIQAVKEKDLIAIDPDTGVSENFGIVTKKRRVGNADLWLTYDELHRMWWIVIQVQNDRLRKVGFIEARREVCWETFLEMGESDVAKLKAS
jgi:hypothetical protein